MLARTATAAVLVIGVTLTGGCSDSAAPAPALQTQAAAPATSAMPSNPIAATAYEFLDAVFAGDTTRADQQLTPAAAQQLAVSGQRFAPPGNGPTSFAIGEVRVLSQDRAAVECLVRGELQGESVAEPLGCLLRKVDGRWGVSGIAYEVAPGERPTVFDFEKVTPPAKTDFVASPVNPAADPGARTANQPAGGTLR